MAAHEEKISDKRRKLFKALSAAPVVMTLRPGSALANQSAYQCLDLQGATPANFHVTDPGCPDGATCYGYFQRPYWDPTDGSGTAVPDKECPGTVAGIIVKTRLDTFYNLQHQEVSDLVVQNSNGTLDLLDNNGDACLTGITRRDGLFLILGEPLDEAGLPVSGSSDAAVDYQPLGVYPEFLQTDGVNQGITGTCMASVSGAVPPRWKLSQG